MSEQTTPPAPWSPAPPPLSAAPAWLPPPPSAPLPRRPVRTGSPFATRWLIAIAVAVVGVSAATAAVVHSRADRAFIPGDCVVVTSSAVQRVDCGSTHDGQVSAVLHRPYESCPAGSDEYDLADNSANLCIARPLGHN